MQPCEAGFHRESDFIHQRWISPVEDGFDCVFSVKDNTLTPLGIFYFFLSYDCLTASYQLKCPLFFCLFNEIVA